MAAGGGGEALRVETSWGGLHVRRWRAQAADGAPRGRVVVVHGYGEHCGRYARLAGALNGVGWDVLGYDQRGHGHSPGRRGVLPEVDALVDDLDTVLGAARELLPGPGPGLLLGHSMGGLVVVRHLQTRRGTVDGAVLSAPWLGGVKGVSWWQRLLSRVMAKVAPDLAVPAPIDPDRLTRDPEEAAARAADPLVHGRASAGLMVRTEQARRAALGDGPPAGLPLLVLVPGDDRLLDQEPTRRWSRSASADDVTLVDLPGRRHEPLHDRGRDEVARRILGWLEERRGGTEQGIPERVCSRSRDDPDRDVGTGRHRARGPR